MVGINAAIASGKQYVASFQKETETGQRAGEASNGRQRVERQRLTYFNSQSISDTVSDSSARPEA